MSDVRFQNRVVLVTGAGSGLGRDAAVRLATEGASLVLVDISELGLEETRDAITAEVPDAPMISVVADVSEEQDVARYVKSTQREYGRIDGFFNNAGIEGQPNLTEDYAAAEFDRVVAVNLRGAFLGLSHVLPVMREQGNGMVVNTASVGGIRGVGFQSGYAATKHGVVGMTRNSAVEYGRWGIRVNAIAPGAIWTPMVEGAMSRRDPDDPVGAAERFAAGNPAGRIGQPGEVSGVVAFLLSADASYVNGVVVPIDGGQSAKY